MPRDLNGNPIPWPRSSEEEIMTRLQDEDDDRHYYFEKHDAELAEKLRKQ